MAPVEYTVFQNLEHEKAITDLTLLENSVKELRGKSKLFDYLFTRTKEIYSKIPLRKNGEQPFVHPLNIIRFLEEAGVEDEATLCMGLIHDLIEEEVDLYKDKEDIKNYKSGMIQLDEYEESLVQKFREELYGASEAWDISKDLINDVLEGVKLLTRHKQDFYYKTIMDMFAHVDENIKEKAIRVKLADRTHNILCIQCFSEEERNNQCFKNLFILNKTKIYLKKKYGDDFFVMKKRNQTERLFTMCAKATYDAYLRTAHISGGKGLNEIRTMLQMAFKKFALEYAGVWEITTLDESNKHPMRLYQGIIRKYDYRLHRKWKRFEEMKQKQIDFCAKFFKEFNFSDEQIQAIIDYKDAYSLKEIVAYLLYLPEYTIKGFDTVSSVNEN